MSPLFYAAGEVRPGLHFALQNYTKIMTYARADVIFSDFSCLNAKDNAQQGSRKGFIRLLSDFYRVNDFYPTLFVVPSTSSPIDGDPFESTVASCSPYANLKRIFFSFVLTHCLFDNTVAAYASIAPPIFSKKRSIFILL
jgi:hypothetical protein